MFRPLQSTLVFRACFEVKKALDTGQISGEKKNTVKVLDQISLAEKGEVVIGDFRRVLEGAKTVTSAQLLCDWFFIHAAQFHEGSSEIPSGLATFLSHYCSYFRTLLLL